MDTFYEQITAVKKTGKSWAAIIGIWLLALVVMAISFLLMGTMLSFIAVFLFAGAIYGAYKWTSRFSVEYEYIITNGTVDIDKIMAKSMRKRMTSFDLSDVSRLEKYNPSAQINGNFSAKIIACNQNDPNAYLMVASRENNGDVLIVMSPNDRMKSAMVKFLPKYIANSAFK